MEIFFKSWREEELCNNDKAMQKKFGSHALMIQKRLFQLKASLTMDLFWFDAPHPLDGERKWCIGVTTVQPYRIIFKPVGEFDISNRATITDIEIQELDIDYH